MNDLDIFGSKNMFHQIVLPCPKSRTLPTQDLSEKEASMSVLSIETGTDYATEYVAKEEKQLLEAANCSRSHVNDEHKFDDVSQGTELNDNDVHCKDFTKIYKTYNFAYRPKSNLTITSMKDRIVSMIETNPVIVIQGPTGCGKTTQVPQFILDSCYKKRTYCNIIVTQPRRIAAISIAKRVSHERDWPVGTLVGYQVGMVNNTSQDTRLTYCTTGVLLHKLINAKHMLDYSHVILDEVHERDQDMDFLLLVVRQLLRTNSRTVKVVLMSATFNVEKFAKYFSSPIRDKLVPAPIIDIAKQRYFNVNIFYLCQIRTLGPLPEVSADQPQVSHEIMDFCVRIVIVLDDLDMQADDAEYDTETGLYERHVILIFLPGINEIEEMHNLLSSPKYRSSKWDIVVLHSMITNEEQQRIFEKPPKGYRRIILSTNIAESSITVPDVKYVIDFCLMKQLVVDPITNFQCLELVWASKANCIQRAGRAGRVMNGRVYRLVPKNFYDNVLPDEATPEMLRAPLGNLVLKTKILAMGEPKAILALSLDPPDLSGLLNTILLLKEAGALLNVRNEMQQFDGELTDLGRIMASLPLDIHITKLIVLGHAFSVLRDAIIIGASMAIKDMFNAPFKKKLLAYNVKVSWANQSSSDCMGYLNVYKVWLNEKANRRLNDNTSERKWADRNFVQIKVLREVEALVQEITMRLKRLGITETVGLDKVVWNDTERPFILKLVIAGAFYPNYFVKRLQTEQVDEREGIKLLGGLDPTRTVYLRGWPIRQPGVLYARRIQEVFKSCLNSSIGNVKVLFDASSRVYVQFNKSEITIDRQPEISRGISLPVYRAIKMRQCNVPIQVPLLNEEVAQQKAESLHLLRNTSNMFFNEHKPKVEKICLPYSRPQLPGLDISYIPLRISSIIDPGHFWACLNDTETWINLKKIETLINNLTNSLVHFVVPPEIGSLVLAPVPMNKRNKLKYGRATIDGYSTGDKDVIANVTFVDYGNKSQMRLSDLRRVEADSDIINIPASAFECVLANVQPSVTQNLSEQWARASYDVFYELVQRNECFGEIYSIVNSVVALNLICTTENNKKINVNKLLIDKGFAMRKEEDYLSRHNCDLRKQYANMSVEQRLRYEQMQYDENSLDCYPDPPDTSECRSNVRLRGPFSPLEFELVSLTIASRGKKINIDGNSVNSVLLDNNPEDPHERLFVAGSVNQGAFSNNLTLRHTTLMPNIPGLTALLILIFTPRMELRCNKFRSCYIGALCGLGYNSFTKKSVFPEHDMEIHFDVEITTEDITNINILRHWMNIGMRVNDDTDENMHDTITCQNRIKDTLFKLIKKPRKMQRSETIDHFEMWNRYDKSLFLEPNKILMIRNNIYSLHNALILEKRDEKNEEMIDHIKQLRSLAIEDIRKVIDPDIQCKLCEENIFSIAELRGHLYSSKHRGNEEKLKMRV